MVKTEYYFVARLDIKVRDFGTFGTILPQSFSS